MHQYSLRNSSWRCQSVLERLFSSSPDSPAQSRRRWGLCSEAYKISSAVSTGRVLLIQGSVLDFRIRKRGRDQGTAARHTAPWDGRSLRRLARYSVHTRKGADGPLRQSGHLCDSLGLARLTWDGDVDRMRTPRGTSVRRRQGGTPARRVPAKLLADLSLFYGAT